MSWFNFNDSLNNIKGQITSLANEVLADGIVNDADPAKTKIDELQELISNQRLEIQSLRVENLELKEKHVPRKAVDYEAANDDGWTWDPPETGEDANKTVISELRNKIKLLEDEKLEMVKSMEQLDFDCQQTTDKLLTMKDELQTNHNKLKDDYNDLLQKNTFLLKVNEENQKKIKALESNDSTEKSYAIKTSDLESQVMELNKKLAGKTSEFEILSRKMEGLSLKDQEIIETDSLEIILQEYENKLITYEREIEKLKQTNAELQQNITSTQNELGKVKEENTRLIDRNNSSSEDTKEVQYSQKNIDDLHNLLTNKDVVIETLQKEINDLKSTLDEEKGKLHTKYIDILKESISKCTDHEFSNIAASSQLSEYTNIIEIIVELILNYKWKCETLDKEVINVSEEKTKLLTEKNCEIEKLLKNSEDLSKEVILKSQDLKHYQKECTELTKNNELLLARLDELKVSSSLQTIHETGEDNMLQMESQLETSNRRVEELELILSDLKSGKQDNSEEQAELSYIKNQLNMTGKELSDVKSQYETLLGNYSTMETENQSLKSNLEDMKATYDECYSEKEDLNLTVDQIKSEYDHTEYKYAEQNINMETLQEEIETHLNTIGDLTNEYKKIDLLKTNYEGQVELMQKEIDDLKQELTAEIESGQLKDTKIETLGLEVETAKKLVTDLNQKIEDLTKESKELQLTICDLERNHGNYSSDMETLRIQLTSLLNETEIIREKHRSECDELKKEVETLKKSQEKSITAYEGEITNLKLHINELQNTVEANDNLVEYTKRLHEELKLEYETLTTEKSLLQSDFNNFKGSVAENNCVNDEDLAKIASLEQQIAELTASRNQMIQLIQDKHQENINYHSEIQKLQNLLSIEIEKRLTFETQLQNLNATSVSIEELTKKDEEIEKLAEQNNFLREKCTLLAENLLQEQSNVQKINAERSETSERELVLQKKLDTLKQHLIEVEDTYTKEVQSVEVKCEDMRMKLQEVEQREKNSSNRYTSINIRANQQVETLQTQMQLVTNQRDELRKKTSDYEDEVAKQTAALTNLQSVLQQFQKDKEKDVHNETERIRKQITIEKQAQLALEKEVNDLKAQLEDSKQGLKAARRLGDQVDCFKSQVSTLKDEAHGLSMINDACWGSRVSKYQVALEKSEEKYKRLTNQTDGKVDKMLIKNLIIGLISSNNNLTKDQQQILKIISTVLDFNQQDIEKVQLNKIQQHTWFGALLHPAGQLSQESLSAAFIKFLEAESKPRELPNLLESTSAAMDSNPGDSSKSSSVRHSPILLNEIVLPTFADFGQNRNSSSILKDVLKDNSNS